MFNDIYMHLCPTIKEEQIIAVDLCFHSYIAKRYVVSLDCVEFLKTFMYLLFSN